MAKPRKPKEVIVVQVQEEEVPSLEAQIALIQTDKDKTVSQKRRAIARLLGLTRAKRKYVTPEEKREAARKRRLERIERQNRELEKYGLARKTRPKLTPEQKALRKEERKEARKEKRKISLAGFHQWLLEHPEEAARLHKTQTLAELNAPPPGQYRLF